MVAAVGDRGAFGGVAARAAARMGVDPAAYVVVEDSRPGVLAARAAGMRRLGYGGGVTPAGRLAGPGTAVFHDLRELPALLTGRGAVLTGTDKTAKASRAARARGPPAGGPHKRRG
ncbi:HAD hydrolase-like protein [Streptomyces sp. KMM 9044]|uniref:HAD hydrolase-like protein n=1 Tax=Streptomyces sp. KMM 9044 TaxID=2744474 RepID=UPI0021714080